MKSGYILLEVIIASAIAAMLSTILLTSMTQLNRSTMAAYSMMSLDTRAMLFFKQLEHDISTAFIPKTKKEQEKKPAPAVASPTSKQQQTSQQPEKIELEPLTKSCIGKMADGRFQELSFITTQRLPSYNMVKSRIARLIYRLEQEPERKDSWRITRYETVELPFKETPKDGAQNFVIIDGIKDFKMEFVAYITEQKVEKQSGQTEQKQEQAPKKRVVVHEWPSKEIEKQFAGILPDQIVVKMTLWDMSYKRETKILYTIPIMTQELVSTQTQQPTIQKPQQPGVQQKVATTYKQPGAITPQPRRQIARQLPTSQDIRLARRTAVIQGLS